MTNLVIGLLATALTNNPPGMLTNVSAPTASLKISATNSEAELNEIMAADDAAHDEVDGWIKENQVFAANGAPIPASELNERILRRLQPIRQAYLNFIQRYPSNAPARIAYASYLDGIGEEDAQAEQLEKARDLDPKNPAAWNQLANYYGHGGELTNAFACYAKAIEIDASEPVYYWNLATTVYLYRVDAEGYYHINEQQVFDKSLALYAQALKLDPTNFSLATDLAQSYYGIRPMRTNDALVSWTNALKVAKSDIEREGIYIHLARVKTYVGLYQEAYGHIDAVTNAMYADLKARLTKNLARLENETRSNALMSVSTNSMFQSSPSTNELSATNISVVIP